MTIGLGGKIQFTLHNKVNGAVFYYIQVKILFSLIGGEIEFRHILPFQHVTLTKYGKTIERQILDENLKYMN